MFIRSSGHFWKWEEAIMLQHLSFLSAIFTPFFTFCTQVSHSAVRNSGLLTRGRDHFYCLSDRERLNNRREMWLCYAVVLLSLCRKTPIEMRDGILGFGEDQQHSEIGRPLFQGQKVRLFLSFVIDAAPSFHWIPVDSRRLYCEAGSF